MSSFESNKNRIAVKFGLFQMLGVLVFIILCLALGFCFGKNLEAIIFIPAIYSMRIFAGGFHANSKWLCFVVSILVVLVGFSLMNFMGEFLQVASLVVAISTITIWKSAPVGDWRKPLSDNEKKAYGKTAKIISIFWVLLFFIATFLGWKEVQSPIAVAFLIVLSVLIAGQIKNNIECRHTFSESK